LPVVGHRSSLLFVQEESLPSETMSVWKFGGNRLVPLTPELVRESNFPPETTEPPVELDISCRVWNLSSLQALGELLPKDLSSLKIFKFDDIIAGLQTEDGLASLAWLGENMAQLAPNLTTLDFHQNATGLRGVMALKPLLQLRHLHSIDASNNGMSKEIMQAFNELLFNRANLQCLKLGRNQAGPGGGVAVRELITACTQLREFWYDGCRALSAGTEAVLEGLIAMGKSHLEDLNLHDCTVKESLLLPALANAPNLRYLNLSSCEIDVLQEADILDLLKTYSLVKLDLSYHDEWVEDGNLSLLISYLKDAPKVLQDFSIEGCSLGDEGLVELLEALALHPITRLNLESNGLEDARAFCEQPLLQLQVLILKDNIDLTGLPELRASYPLAEIIVDEDQQEQLDAAVATQDDSADDLADLFAGVAV
jgi:Leucine Rich repeat